MCGLVGYCGSVRPNLPAMKLMSINIKDRGTDSTGILLNNLVTKGYYQTYQNDYSSPVDFFKYYSFYNTLKSKWESNTCIIHNRLATRGAKTKENAHPFVYEKDGVTHYFAHNGTLLNETKLCEKYGYDLKDHPVDSMLLGQIIVDHGFDVLKDYTGYAAFLYYRDDKPNTLFVFKGMSKEKGILNEERPLFAASIKGGTYFCSTKLALLTSLDLSIDPKDEIVIDLQPNILYEFHKGKSISETIYDRTNIENKPEVYQQNIYQKTHDLFKNKKDGKKDKNSLPKLCYHYNYERNPQSIANNKIYYYMGLYFRNGHLCSGKMLVNPNTGEVSLKSDLGYEIMYFHMGLMARNEDCYNKIKEIVKVKNDIIDKVTKIIGLISHNHLLFLYEYSELRNGYHLKLYSKGGSIIADKYSYTPMFGYYKYEVDLRNSTYMVYEKKTEKEMKEKDVEQSWIDYYADLPNFNKPDVMVYTDNSKINGKLSVIMKAINNTISDTTEELQKNMDDKLFDTYCRLMVCKYVMSNSEIASQLFDELELDIYDDSEK